MSKMGVPSTRSAPVTRITVPSPSSRSTAASFTQDRPMGLGRKGERVANTPSRTFPPSRGGRTVGDQSCRLAWENSQMSHRWENPSMPRRASGSRNSGSNTTVDTSSSTRPLCLGTPNLVGKSDRIWATGRIGHLLPRAGRGSLLHFTTIVIIAGGRAGCKALPPVSLSGQDGSRPWP